MTPEDALAKAVAVLGGQSGMARELEARTNKQVKQQHVWNWINRSGRLPDRFAFAVQAATEEAGETVLAEDLCPDLFPSAAKPATDAA